jgi:hypothetical protein
VAIAEPVESHSFCQAVDLIPLCEGMGRGGTPSPHTRIVVTTRLGCARPMSVRVKSDRWVCRPRSRHVSASPSIATRWAVRLLAGQSICEGDRLRVPSGKIAKIARKSRHAATISPTTFAIRAFDKITGRPQTRANSPRCASVKPMQSSSSACAPLRASETPVSATTSRVSV